MRTWAPLVGLAGTVAGVLFAFVRTGTEPEWKTALQSVGVGLVATAFLTGLVLGLIAVRPRRRP